MSFEVLKEYIIFFIFAGVGGLVLVLGLIKLRTYRLIKDIPRSKVRSLAMGLVEIHGSVEDYESNYIITPFSKTDCLFFKYRIEEYRRQKKSSRWVTIAHGTKGVPFLAKDETGEVLVDPTGADAELHKDNVFYEKRGSFFNFSFGLKSLGIAIDKWSGKDSATLTEVDQLNLIPESKSSGIFKTNKVGDRKYHEYFIVPGDKLYLLGTAAIDKQAPNGTIIRKGQNEKTFIISDKDEKGVLKELVKTIWVLFAFGGLFFVVGIFMLLKKSGYIE